jgi:hypothetical protein
MDFMLWVTVSYPEIWDILSSGTTWLAAITSGIMVFLLKKCSAGQLDSVPVLVQ